MKRWINKAFTVRLVSSTAIFKIISHLHMVK